MPSMPRAAVAALKRSTTRYFVGRGMLCVALFEVEPGVGRVLLTGELLA